MYSIILVSLLGLTAALPAKRINVQNLPAGGLPLNSAIEQIILNLLENVRGIMVTGTDSIPVLDPFNLDNLEIDGAIIGLDGSYFSMSDVEMANLSTFVIDDLTLTSSGILNPTFLLEFDGNIPSLDLNAEKYNVSINTGGIHIFGDGKARIRFIKPNVKGNVHVSVSLLGLSATIRDCHVTIGLDNFESNISGLFGDDVASAFVDAFLQRLIPQVIKMYEAQISQVMSEAIIIYGNQILANLDIGSIIG